MLAVLKGKKVKDANTADGYLAISFDDGDSGINVYNNFEVFRGILSDLTGAMVVAVDESDDHLKITFSTGACLLIGRQERDYNGPESLIYFAGGNFYVNQ